jgi:hypothetical protein
VAGVLSNCVLTHSASLSTRAEDVVLGVFGAVEGFVSWRAPLFGTRVHDAAGFYFCLLGRELVGLICLLGRGLITHRKSALF